MKRIELFNSKPQDKESWKKLHKKYQQKYLRRRLQAIDLLWSGKGRVEVSKLISCKYETLTKWIDIYNEEGLTGLIKPIKREQSQRLSGAAKADLKEIILNQTPSDYGFDRYIWTGELIGQLIEEQWQVSFKKTRIYEILDEMNLSYQRSHRDYENADKVKQKAYVEKVKKK